MFDNWRKRRKLERELKQIYNHYAPSLTAAKTEEDYRAEVEPYLIDVAETRAELEAMATRKTRNKAEKFGFDFPPFETSEENWEDIPYSSRKALSERAHAKINREVSTARFAYWKAWVEILVRFFRCLCLWFSRWSHSRSDNP